MCKISSKRASRQLAVAFTVSVSLFILGMIQGWSAPTLKKFREPDAPFHLTTSEEAMVVNALYFTTMLSPLPCGVLMNRVGRKTALLILTISPIASWVLIYFSNSACMLFVARLCAGFWAGGTQTILPIYIAEIAEPQVRGLLGSFFTVMAYSGSLPVLIIAPEVSIQTLAIIGCVFPPIFFALFALCPESPYYYVMRGRHGAAAEELAWLRGGAPIDSELTTIQTYIEKEAQSAQGKITKMLSLVTVPANRKIMGIVQIMQILYRFSGMTTLLSFSTVLIPAHLGPLTNDHCSLILGIVWLLASFICTALIDRLGRRPLLYLSGIGMIVSMLPTATWYYLDMETSSDVSGYNWVPFAGFLFFGITFNAGMGPIVPIFTGEMFPSNLKGEAAALTTMTSAAFSAIIIALFVKLTTYVGLYANFLVYAAVGLITLIFTYFFVIETKGKTLQMIQAELKGEVSQQPGEDGSLLNTPKGCP